MPDVVEWEDSKKPIWSSLQYVTLRNASEVNNSLSAAIDRAPHLSRLTPAQRLSLIQTLGTLFVALGATTPQEYLDLIKPLRKPRYAPQENALVRYEYKKLTGRPIPRDLSTAQALELFWKGRQGGPSHPVEASLNDPKGLAFGIGDFDAQWKSKNRQNDPNYQEMWGNPASTGFVPLTVPLEDSDDTLRKDGIVLRIDADTVFRSVEHCYAPVCVRLFWSTITERWWVEYVNIQMDENFFWPI